MMMAWKGIIVVIPIHKGNSNLYIIGISASKMCWAKVPGIPPDMMWPARIINIQDDGYTVYCESDNAE